MGRKPKTEDVKLSLTLLQRLLMFWTICVAGLSLLLFKITRLKIFIADTLKLICRMDRMGLLNWKGQIWLRIQMALAEREGGEA